MCTKVPFFVPDTSLTLPGDFDSVSTSGTGVIEESGGKIHTETNCNNHSGWVTKDVFGASGAEDLYVELRWQENTGTAACANWLDIVRIRDTDDSRIEARLSLTDGYKLVLWNFFPTSGIWLTAEKTVVVNTEYAITICLDRAGTDKARMVVDGVNFDTADTGLFGADPFRYLQVGAFDSAPGSAFHETLIDQIAIGTGGCSCFEAFDFGPQYHTKATFAAV